MRLSKRQLLAELREILDNPAVQLRKGKLKREHGLTYYERTPGTNELTNIKIVVDPRNSPVISIVVHELLHVYFAREHKIDQLFTTPLEEAMVEGLEKELERYLHDAKNERLFQSWVKTVEAKLR